MKRGFAGLVAVTLGRGMLFAGTALAQEASVPRVIQFNGVLQDSAGRALTGVQGVTFALYREQEGGAPLWIETQNVTADAEGRFAALLGATTSEGVPLELFASGESRWLGVQPNQPGEPEQPRVLLVSVPYALKAADAETLGGKPLSAFVLAAPSRDREGAVSAASPTDSASDKPFLNTAAVGLPTAAVSAAGVIPKFTDGSGTLDVTAAPIAESGTDVGIGTTTPGTKLDVNGTIRAVANPGAPFGTYLLPIGGPTNSFRLGLGNNLYFDGTNWRTKGDGANNAGSGILTDIGLGDLQIFTVLSTGPDDQVVSNSSFNSHEKFRITAAGRIRVGTTAPATTMDVNGTIRAVANPGAPFGTYLLPIGGPTNSFRLGLGNNLYFDGTNWRTKGDGANNAGSGILTDIGLGHLQIFTLPSTGATDQVISNASFAAFEKVRIAADGKVGIGTNNPGAKLDVNGTIAGDGASITNLNAGNIASGTLAVARGGTGAAPGAGDQVLVSDSTTAATWRGIPDCNTNNMLTYTASSNTFGCDSDDAGGGTVFSVSQGTGISLSPNPITTAGTVALSAAALTRNITYLAGCDTCSPLLATDDQRTIYVNLVGVMTINSVTCFSDAGTGTINVKRQVGANTPANILTSNLTCDADGETSANIVGGQGTLNLNEKLDFEMVSVDNTVKRVTVTIKTTLQ